MTNLSRWRSIAIIWGKSGIETYINGFKRGATINLDEAYIELADSLSEEVQELSEHQKQAAVMKAVMEQA